MSTTLTRTNTVVLTTVEGETQTIECVGLPWRWKDFLCWKDEAGQVTYFPWDQYESFRISELVR
jgi:hypothetical protein